MPLRFFVLLAIRGSSADEADPTFVQWLADGGATIHPSLALRRSSSYGVRGLHTSSEIDAGTTLGLVPRRLWFDDSNTEESRVGPLIAQIKSQAKRLPKHAALAILMVHEKLQGDASFWAPFFRHLPASYPELPLSWSGSRQRAVFSGIPMGMSAWLVAEHLDYAKREFSMLEQVVFGRNPELFPQATPHAVRDAYVWAYCTICSRAHSVENLHAVIPWIDTPNHNVNAAGRIGDLGMVSVLKAAVGKEQQAEVQGIRLLANRAYVAGEELFYAYDNVTKCHAQMLTLYGFTDASEAGRDCFYLHIDDSAFGRGGEARAADYRMQLLARHGLERQPGAFTWFLQLPHSHLGGSDPRNAYSIESILLEKALPTLRAMLLPPMEASSTPPKHVDKLDLRRAVKGVDEVAVWRALQTAVTASAEPSSHPGVASEGGDGGAADGVVAQWLGPALRGSKRVQGIIEEEIRQRLREHQAEL